MIMGMVTTYQGKLAEPVISRQISIRSHTGKRGDTGQKLDRGCVFILSPPYIGAIKGGFMSNTGPTKCSVCGKAHWMRDPHVWDDEPKKLAIKEVLGMANGKVSMANSMANNIGCIAPGTVVDVPHKVIRASDFSTYKYRDAEKRRAYQREYMRKRREQIKEVVSIG